ncbi:MAG: D-alanyl-D-alanine carboxypeptidase family protein [Eubacteriaceae bacterium]
MKKFITLVISGLLIMNFATVEAEDLELESLSTILIDADSGQILFEQNSHEQLPPASITKIMTMLIIMEEIDKGNIGLQDNVTVSQFAADMGGSQLYLEPNEVRIVDELLKAVAVESANDAAVALAEYIAGDYQSFISIMNKRAKELNMKDTNFENANGLPSSNHYSSAYDIALMSKELLKYSNIHNYLTIWMEDITIGVENDKIRTIANTNKLLKLDNRVDGIKTGYTSEAKYCLSASAKQGNMKLISVVLQAPSSKVRFEETKKLLDYGFNKYKKDIIIEKNEPMGEVSITKGAKEKLQIVANEGFSQLMETSVNKEYVKEINIQKNINAPVVKGDIMGKIIIKESGNVIKEVDLVASEDIPKITIFNLFNKLSKDFFIF